MLGIVGYHDPVQFPVCAADKVHFINCSSIKLINNYMTAAENLSQFIPVVVKHNWQSGSHCQNVDLAGISTNQCVACLSHNQNHIKKQTKNPHTSFYIAQPHTTLKSIIKTENNHRKKKQNNKRCQSRKFCKLTRVIRSFRIKKSEHK